MGELPIIGKLQLNQKRLIAITSGSHHTISVAEAATILNMPTQAVAKLMARWAEAGNLSRIKRGMYLTLPQKSGAGNTSPMRPWVIAENLFRPCYIGGIAAAAHWNLIDTNTEGTVVLTTQKPRNRHLLIQGEQFVLRSISPGAMFGLQSVRLDQNSILISDASRTLVDFLVDPSLAGGLPEVIGIFKKYLKSNHRNVKLLFDYAWQMHNGAVSKRLGFLLERLVPEERNIIMLCKYSLTTGYVKLHPQFNADKLITRWLLWVPEELESILRRNQRDANDTR